MELLAQSSDTTQGTPLLLLLLPTVVAVAFGAWSANAAARKGIPRWVGWLLGIFLLLIGRIIVGLVRDRRGAAQLAHNEAPRVGIDELEQERDERTATT